MPTYQYRCVQCEITFERTQNYFRARDGEAEMSEMWEQEGLGCAGSHLRVQKIAMFRFHWKLSEMWEQEGLGCAGSHLRVQKIAMFRFHWKAEAVAQGWI